MVLTADTRLGPYKIESLIGSGGMGEVYKARDGRELINALAQVEGLKVIARTSAFSFKGKNEDVRSIGKVLGVTNMLEGSVRRAGVRIRVTAQLIAAADGTHLWSERFDRPMIDVFAMQDDIAGAITAALKGRLNVARTRARQYVPNIDAYAAYLSGRTYLNQFTPKAWSRAKADLDRAMRADPSYAKPHAELALAYFIRGMHFMQPMREVEPFVRAEVTRALELDPTDPQPRFVLGGNRAGPRLRCASIRWATQMACHVALRGSCSAARAIRLVPAAGR